MAIEKGINIGCGNLQASGGIKNILIRTWKSTDVVTYVNTNISHSIDSISDTTSSDTPDTAIWFNYEFKNELPTFTSTASRENGSTMFENSLTFMMPEMTVEKSAALQGLMDTCMMAIAVGNNGIYYVLGVSEKYENEKVPVRNQTYASMTSVEGASGAAYNDDSGYTVTLSCKQWEAPRIYTGTLTLYATADTSKTT
tara:strand:- start:585 stop:1178 length:594 start_codon:yes stop_codon:yes gene_type:complete